MAPKRAERCRSFRLTIFPKKGGLTLDEIDRSLRGVPLKGERCLAFQKERCPETGKLHLQGFLQVEKEISYDTARKLFPDGKIWIMKADNPQGALEYANKDETRVEGYEPFKRGSIKKQGGRSDIHGACAAVVTEGYVNAFLKMPEVFVKYGRGLKEYDTILREQNAPEVREVQVEVYWGDPGSGKSWFCANVYKNECYRLPLPRGKGSLWFDGYRGEKVLIIEDFNGWLQYKELLRILDGLKERWQIKGGFIIAEWELVLITANEPPNSWYRDYKERDGVSTPQDIWDQRNDPGTPNYKPSALQRRINRIVSCKGMFPRAEWTQTLPLIDGKEVVLVEPGVDPLDRFRVDPLNGEEEEEAETQVEELDDALLNYDPFKHVPYNGEEFDMGQWELAYETDEHGIPIPT